MNLTRPGLALLRALQPPAMSARELLTRLSGSSDAAHASDPNPKGRWPASSAVGVPSLPQQTDAALLQSRAKLPAFEARGAILDMIASSQVKISIFQNQALIAQWRCCSLSAGVAHFR